MNNKEIANAFNLLGQLMELHGENKFKIRSYSNAYRHLRKLETPLAEMSTDDIAAQPGVGKAILGKIQELLEKGEMNTLNRYLDQTPAGIVELMSIKGLGIKKIQTIWQDLGVESVGELLYAINENRLIELKGFGAKTQEDLRKKLDYFLQSKGKYLYAAVEPLAEEWLSRIQAVLPEVVVEETGALRRRSPIIEQLEFLVGSTAALATILAQSWWQDVEEFDSGLTAKLESGVAITIYFCSSDNFGNTQLRYTSTEEFRQSFEKEYPEIANVVSEVALFEGVSLPYIAPELREDDTFLYRARAGKLPVLIEEKAIKGVVHAHSTYSDGVNTIKEMATYAQSQGYTWLGMTDHSQSAFYANGLKVDRLLQQFNEIDAINTELTDFRILKGIESDILYDGRLDYEDEVLAQFDFIIASVHSQLKMDEEKATSRLITAIENPYTSILGHPTGRILLAREGYPIDHAKVIDACAANKVAIEINANPHRLDLDWRWVSYALERGVKIAINPDAHSTQGIHDIKYGTYIARKGGVTAADCLNTLSAEEFLTAIKK